MPQSKHILVIGAGVIGLQTAIALLEAGHHVSVVAKHLPGDMSVEYTSPWAAAIWRSNALPEETQIQRWDSQSYRIWLRLCSESGKREDNIAQAVTEFPMRLLWTGPHKFIPNGPSSIWYARHVRNFNTIPQTQLPRPFTSGATHDGIAVNTTPYLIALADRVQSLGGHICQAELSTPAGLGHAITAAENVLQSQDPSPTTRQPVDLVVNASGLGARTLVPDLNVYPIRGQTVTVRGEAKHITTMFYPDANASITPRAGAGVSLLGSSYEEDNWDPKPDEQTIRKIMERCKPLAPELLNEQGEFDVVSVNVAFRPGRKGGPRVELEEVMSQDAHGRMRQMPVCHAYGHAGGG
ncbi:hypothetical protein A1O1_07922 [Capronia coronata CBS 617.96]|uniref:FAD dependent oxidoreductase domain-containing protein n=1 Tax=Capronia coronata CBS 617.96 TaxID=1182541 RepID=W9XMX3_9EURO|nr:uncharacterized protein A1O1_07922 [Capronia coronata CBS 617.96]EXJ81857.1 hypothetical protein A1O1_07922 [Capronia coronata CBS 617.96]